LPPRAWEGDLEVLNKQSTERWYQNEQKDLNRQWKRYWTTMSDEEESLQN